eukprot:TRINITY_DN43542_c0_g1_i1.p1 TRINITY_DN43542_c0_g1~~TRINITY_DN43542_c0_g1_i1.p1  ORF type:complete len:399 (+),score=143.04 TRINITY_DN43542_c0_g1_i1:139-1335(+)
MTTTLWKGAMSIGKSVSKGVGYVTGTGGKSDSADKKNLRNASSPEEEMEGEEMGEFGGGEIGKSSDGSLKTFKGHTAAVYGVAFAPGAQRFVSGGADKTLRIWNLNNEISPPGEKEDGADEPFDDPAPVVRTIKHHQGVVLACDFSPTGNEIVSCSDSGKAFVFDSKSTKQLHVLEGHTQKVYGVVFSPVGSTCPGQYIASVSLDNTVRLWNTETGKQEGILKGHSDNVFAVNFSRGGRQLATAGDDRKVLLWDWRQGKKSSSLSGHCATVWSVAYSNDDMLMVTAGMGHEVKVWDLRKERPLWSSDKAHAGMPVHQAIFSADDKHIISGGRDRKACVWEADTGSKIVELSGHTGTVYHLAMHPAGDRLLTSSVDSTMKLWSYPPVADDDERDASAMP